MARYELLNNVAHKDLRIATHFGAALGDAVGTVLAFPTEFAELQREYPIFFRRNKEGGDLYSVALLGFDSTENLFLQGREWNASYVPGAVSKGPFLIGSQERMVDGELRQEPVIHIDCEHPRVTGGEGAPVFLPHGGHSPYLQHIITILRGIHDGFEIGKQMFAAFDALGLVQPMTVDVRFDDSQGVNLTGLWGIDRERLAALSAESLFQLHRAGFLEGAYLMLASLQNVRRLIAAKQRRLRAQAADAPAGGA